MVYRFGPEKNEVRQTISEETARKKALVRKGTKADSKEDTTIIIPKKDEKFSLVVLYEKNVEIVDSSSRIALAKGVAYMNKEGQIIKIKIIKE